MCQYDQLNFRYLLNVLLFIKIKFTNNNRAHNIHNNVASRITVLYVRKKSCCKKITHHIHFPPSSISISYFNQSTKRTCKVGFRVREHTPSMRYSCTCTYFFSTVLSSKRQNKHLISISYFQVDTNKVRTCNKFFLTENQSSSTIWDTVSTVTTIRSESFKPHFCDNVYRHAWKLI